MKSLWYHIKEYTYSFIYVCVYVYKYTYREKGKMGFLNNRT